MSGERTGTRDTSAPSPCRWRLLPATFRALPRCKGGGAQTVAKKGTNTRFFSRPPHATQASPNRHRSGVLIYRFNQWHPAWHLDKLQPPHFLLHTGLRMPNYTLACTNRAAGAKQGAGGDELSDAERAVVAEGQAERAGDVEWKDRFMICPENYPLSAGMLQPASSPGHCHSSRR